MENIIYTVDKLLEEDDRIDMLEVMLETGCTKEQVIIALEVHGGYIIDNPLHKHATIRRLKHED